MPREIHFNPTALSAYADHLRSVAQTTVGPSTSAPLATVSKSGNRQATAALPNDNDFTPIMAEFSDIFSIADDKISGTAQQIEDAVALMTHKDASVAGTFASTNGSSSPVQPTGAATGAAVSDPGQPTGVPLGAAVSDVASAGAVLGAQVSPSS